jgi:hypothetical protein
MVCVKGRTRVRSRRRAHRVGGFFISGQLSAISFQLLFDCQRLMRKADRSQLDTNEYMLEEEE